MRIASITIQNFRNISLAELNFSGLRQFFTGENAQGKTNLLEAAGFISALRSFRASEERTLIAHGKTEAAISCVIAHEKRGETRVTVRLRPGGKEVHCDGERVRKLGDYLGGFPTVVFTSQDMLLVRGSPGGRRRWLDLMLAGTDASYLRALQDYHRALASRNQLLKRGASCPGFEAELAAFEQPLARAAAELAASRAAGIQKLNAHVAAAYSKITASDDKSRTDAPPCPNAALAYAPNASAGATFDEAGWAGLFAAGRQRDTIMRATLCGPHRDDCNLNIGGRSAREFASEGQQRSLALSLRLAEAAYLREQTGIQPVLLADDVLGELDPQRRRQFWASLGENGAPSHQILATGTAPPDSALGAWQLFEVRGGCFSEPGNG